MRQKVLFVAHCLLNTAAKVVMYEAEAMAAEEALRRRFVHATTDAGIQLVQMPCPEFALQGARRWGHTSEQFDNPFFHAHCRKILKPLMLELAEYLANPERFEVLGFLGVDGSPSCGVKYTCTGPWGGNLSGRDDLPGVIAQANLKEGQGVLFRQLEQMLAEKGMDVPLEGLFAPEPERAMGLALFTIM